MNGIEEFRRPGEWGFRASIDMAVPCPLSSCPWTLEKDGAEPAGHKPRIVEPENVAREIAMAADAIIREHLETHALLEWVQEVTRLRAQLEAVTAGDEPAEWRARIEAALTTITARLDAMPPN